jgi:glucose-1-phosphate thymidylyltransferase
LKVKLLGRGFARFDVGINKSFLKAGDFVQTIETRTGLMIGYIKEISYKNGWITKDMLLKLAQPLKNTDYGKYLIEIADL